MRILIADDDAISLRMLRSTLERAGYDVTAVDSGEKACQQLCEPDGPRLALLDWMMPGLKGPEIIREVRARREHPYVHMVLITSKESKDDIVAGLQAGADDYLTKPFHPSELKARLRTGQRILLLEDKLVEAREAMRYKASHDALTDLWNRGVMADFVQRELKRAARSHANVAILMGDVDHFKRVNDTYGHKTGDVVLKEVANRLVTGVRNYDVVSRYGGEEFLLLLPGCDAMQACERAEQLRLAVASTPFRDDAAELDVTMSFGVAVNREWPDRDHGALVREADAALYHAKREGRNCVVLARPGIFEVHRAAVTTHSAR